MPSKSERNVKFGMGDKPEPFRYLAAEEYLTATAFNSLCCGIQ